MVSRGLSPARAVGLAVSAVAVTTLLAGCSVDSAFAGFGWPKGITQQGDRHV